jgi:hypothetical protein
MWLSVMSGIFLAFGWPFFVSNDPAGGSFRALATATLVVFLAALAGIIVVKAIDRRGATGAQG